MTLAEYIETSKMLNDEVNKCGDVLTSVIGDNKYSNGLATDEVKKTNEYKVAKNKFAAAFKRLRDFNGATPKELKREASKLRRQAWKNN